MTGLQHLTATIQTAQMKKYTRAKDMAKVKAKHCRRPDKKAKAKERKAASAQQRQAKAQAKRDQEKAKREQEAQAAQVARSQQLAQ